MSSFSTANFCWGGILKFPEMSGFWTNCYLLQLLLLLLLLLFLTAIGFSPGGSTLTPVQTPQYNNTYINGTAQITVRVIAYFSGNKNEKEIFVLLVYETHNIKLSLSEQKIKTHDFSS
jgi:hypothetical protein